MYSTQAVGVHEEDGNEKEKKNEKRIIHAAHCRRVYKNLPCVSAGIIEILCLHRFRLLLALVLLNS